MPTTNLGLSYLISAQSSPEVTLNADLDLLDTLVVRKTGDALTGGVKITRTAATGTTPAADLWITPPADTALLNAESSTILFDGTAATRQFAGSTTLAQQRFMVVNGPAYSAAAALTITNAATVHILGSPVAGTNTTITNSAALWVQGAVCFGNNVQGTSKAGFSFAQGQNTSQPTAIYVAPVASSTLTASTEANLINFSLARVVTFAAGALTTQREILISAPTYAFASASTLTNAATLAITGAPVAGTNATITNSYSLWSQGGPARFDGTPCMAFGNTDTTALGAFYGRVAVSVPGVGTKFLALYS